MTEQTLVALLGLLGVVLGAAQARTALKLSRLARENHALWYYTRHLIDWGYKPHRADERPPEPPESIRHLYEFGEAK